MRRRRSGSRGRQSLQRRSQRGILRAGERTGQEEQAGAGTQPGEERPMALRVTIDVFSGRPNPVVIITGREEKELLERLAAPKTRGGRKAPKLPPATLGYRGLLVEHVDEPGTKRARSKRPATLRVADGFA